MRANDRLVVAVIAALVLIGGMYLLVVSPERGKVTTLSGEITTEQTALQQAQTQLDSARQSVTAYVGHVHQIDTVMRAVPTSPAVAALIKTIVKLAGTKVDFHELGVSTGAGTAAGPNSLELSFTFGSNYGDLQSFLSALDALTVTDGTNVAATGRLFTVQSVTLSPKAPSSTTASIAATVYVQNPADGSTGATGATG
jgi:Tfp pilus assembly protein PilO